jgi:hypothetical protein
MSISFANANENNSNMLCNSDEELIFGFNVKNSKKMLSICKEKSNDEYLLYRYGSVKKVELEFPESKKDSWDKFTYAYYFRAGPGNAGMDLNNLYFQNGEWKYTVYEESADGEMMIGIKVANQIANKHYDIKGDLQTQKKSLINLRDYDIKKEPM